MNVNDPHKDALKPTTPIMGAGSSSTVRTDGSDSAGSREDRAASLPLQFGERMEIAELRREQNRLREKVEALSRDVLFFSFVLIVLVFWIARQLDQHSES